ncbi:MAG TPA: hypothetical protein VLM37_00890, partial [Fibrobacteraceae bacterium]|nr:hypothetical protein [Fibrobacteraceae bacterium]
LRLREGLLQKKDLSNGVQELLEQVRKQSPFVVEDRPLEQELRALLQLVRLRALPVPMGEERK